MADSKITALTSIGTSTDPAVDPLVLVDVSDTSMAATGTTKKVTLNNLLSTSPTATGNFTITGDLTVDTSTLKVDSANNRVGIGTASPSNTLTVQGADNSVIAKIGGSNRPVYFATAANGGFDNASFIIRHDSSVGQFLFQNNNGSATLATLDSSGNLGLGVVPVTAVSFPIGTTKTVGQSAVSTHVAGNAGTLKFGIGDGGGDYSGLHVVNSHNGTYSSQDLLFFTGEGGVSVCSERMRLTRSGNLGLGVTPSTWGSSYKAIQVGTAGCFNYRNFTNAVGNNYYNDGTNDVKIVNGYALKYEQNATTLNHSWWNSGGGPSTGTVAWTQAMTLDASGNLIVGTTSALGNAAGRGCITVNGSTDSILSFGNAGVLTGYIAQSTSGMDVVGVGSTFVRIQTNGSSRLLIDSSGNMIPTLQTTAPSLGTNNQMVFTLTSNTNLRISVRGSDGTTRTANLTLA